MTEYLVTKTAGKEVGGKPNPGAGKPITLSEAQAEQPLRLGHITPAPVKAAAPSSSSDGDSRRTTKKK